MKEKERLLKLFKESEKITIKHIENNNYRCSRFDVYKEICKNLELSNYESMIIGAYIYNVLEKMAKNNSKG